MVAQSLETGALVKNARLKKKLQYNMVKASCHVFIHLFWVFFAPNLDFRLLFVGTEA